MPPGTRNIYGFAFFNALSFQIILGSPMVLFAQAIGASSTVLGAIAGMTPLLVILQIPAARFVDRVGYKKFVVTGWSIRLFFIALVAAVPLFSKWVDPSVQLPLVLILLLLFNLARGVSSCGWLPWISSIIPASARGRYLTLDSTMVNLASIAVFFASAAILGGAVNPEMFRFSLLFGASMLFGVVSVRYLQKIPAEKKIETVSLPPRPRLFAMLRLRAYRRLLVFNVAWPLACGGVVTFMIAYLKAVAGWSDQRVLLITSSIFLGGLTNQLILSRLLDRYGSKPILIVASVMWMSTVGAITLLAGSYLSLSIYLVGALFFCIGMVSSMTNLANLRLAMLTVPEIGRTHYFAVYSVAGGIALGIAPLSWGVLADFWGARTTAFGIIELNRYAILFLGQVIMSVMMMIFAIRLREQSEKVPLEGLMEEALSGWRLRYWLRPLFRSSPRG